MFKRILVALDGSAASEAALQESLGWARLLGAEVRGVFVEDETRFLYFPAVAYAEGGLAVPATLPQEELARVEDEVREEGRKLKTDFDAALKTASGVTGSFTIVRGDVNAVLARQARAVDLVVMGKRGKVSRETSAKAGPTTEAMVHDSQRPVLVVPAEGRTGGTMLIAYDASRGAQRIVVPAAQMAAAAEVPVVALTCADDEEEGKAQQDVLADYLSGYDIEPQRLLGKGKATGQILEHADTAGAGTIVMGAFGHNPVRELLFGSTTLDVLERTPCAVLLMA